MILPGLEPHLTRGSLGANRLYVEKYAKDPDDFPKGKHGLWLPPVAVSNVELPRAIDKLEATLNRQISADMSKNIVDLTQKGVRLLGRSAVSETGCIVDGLRQYQRASEWVLRFAEWDWGAPSFDEEKNLHGLQICKTDGCYNTRHFDLEFSRPTLRERKVELDKRNYFEREDGKIETIWGDVLPSIEDSLGNYIEFQRRNYPYVDFKESPLTPTAISQIRFVPDTGCWEAWQYYCKPQDNFNWQFDGYGRLYQRYAVPDVNPLTGEVEHSQRRGHWMAHRVVWRASGRKLRKGQVLNHLCSYRRCCNPHHIEQVSPSTNAHHGIRVQKARRATGTSETIPISATKRYFDTRAMRCTRRLYKDISTSLDASC